MATTMDQLRFIIYDVKYSWYFRIWAFFWVLAFVFSFTTLILLSGRADEAGGEQDMRIHITNASQLAFPRIQFSISYHNPGISIQSKSCVHSGTPILTSHCAAVNGVTPGLDKCFSVNSDTVIVYNNGEHTFNKTHIHCYINTTANHVGNNSMLMWKAEGGDNVAYSDLYIAPNDQVWVVLRPINVVVGSTRYFDWQKELLYHSSVSTPGQYAVKTIIGSFYQRDVTRVDSYDGYRAMGDIGGFFYFMIIIHTLLMIIASAVLSNNSKFLGGEVSH